MNLRTCLALFLLLLCGTAMGADEEKEDLISGYNTLIFRTFSDRVFSGTDVRREIEKDQFTLYNFLTIQKLKIYEEDNLRVWGSGSGWIRQDLDDSTFSSSTKADLSYGAIQIDRGRTQDGFLRLGRMYNYQGLINQRFDGLEAFYPFKNGIELDIYGGRRAYGLTVDDDNSWLGGGRVGYRWKRRNTVGVSWLLAHTENQWDDQKIGGDWSFTPASWLDFYGEWGYDRLADEFYEFQAQTRARLSRDFDIRIMYDDITPGLLLPKSSIFSVYSLAQERRVTTQLVYHPGDNWTFMLDGTYIDYDNEGGMGGPNNFFTDINALDGGYQWRYGTEIIYRHNDFDELALRFEQMVEGNYGYTVTDLIRQDFDFRDFDPFNVLPEDAGFVFGKYENGFSSLSFSHWHQWSTKFSSAMNFYYYLYDNPLFLHEAGDDSWTASLTLTYKPSPKWNISLGGRYLYSLADREQMQFYLRLMNRF